LALAYGALGALSLWVVPGWYWDDVFSAEPGGSGIPRVVASREGTELLVRAGLVFVVEAAAGLVFTCVTAYSLGHRLLGRPVGLGEAFSRSVGRVWSVLGATVLVALPVLGVALAAGAVLLVALSPLGVNAILVIGFLVVLACLVPLVVWGVRTVFAAVAAVLEEARPGTAVGRSLRLTRADFWFVLGVVLLTGVISAGAVYLAEMVLVVPAALAGPAGLASATRPITVVVMVLAGLAQVWTMAVVVQLYMRERGRWEGFQLQLPPAGPAGYPPAAPPAAY
jgi:hypothetical protein